MAELRGGTTIAGYTALHSGLKEAFLGGNLTINGSTLIQGTLTMNSDINMNSASNININQSGYGITFGEGSGTLGYIRREGAGQLKFGSDNLFEFYETDSNVLAVSISANSKTVNAVGGFQWNGQSLDSRYVNTTDSYVDADLVGRETEKDYPRLVANNSGASTPGWIRVGNSGGQGLIPYANGVGNLGTSSWKFATIHGVTLYENGTSLSSKYEAKGTLHDDRYVRKTGDSMTGTLSLGQQQAGIEMSNVKIGMVSSTAMVIRGMDQFRFSDSDAWSWNDWGGIKYVNATGELVIGGAQSSYFTSGGTAGNLKAAKIIFDGISSVNVNGKLNIGGDIGWSLSKLSSGILDIYNESEGVSVMSASQSGVGINGDLNLNTYSKIWSGGRMAIDFFGPDNYGNGISIGAGGLVVIGSGESHTAVKDSVMISNGDNAGDEQLHLSSDNHVYVHTNVQDGVATEHLFRFGEDGIFYAPEGINIQNSLIRTYANGHLGFYGSGYSSLWSGWNGIIEINNGSHGMIWNRPGNIGFGLHSNGAFYWAKDILGTGSYLMELQNDGDLMLRGGYVPTVRSSTAGPSGSARTGDIWVQY
jgi:hypothetical protein